jgi:IS66 C-terminal element
MYSILQTAKLNGVNPEAYLTDTLSQIAAGHPINRISELMPWAYQSATNRGFESGSLQQPVCLSPDRAPREWRTGRSDNRTDRRDVNAMNITH